MGRSIGLGMYRVRKCMGRSIGLGMYRVRNVWVGV